jgi:hypothetical protein
LQHSIGIGVRRCSGAVVLGMDSRVLGEQQNLRVDSRDLLGGADGLGYVLEHERLCARFEAVRSVRSLYVLECEEVVSLVLR